MKIDYKLFLLISVIDFAVSDVLVNTTLGQLRGYKVFMNFFTSHYLAFEGIPFAMPPIGDLRFRPPVYHTGWTGILEANKIRSQCPSNGFLIFFAGGEEDCLYLNVYTPSCEGNFPVFFYISGGGFYFSEKSEHRPDDRDIIVVTIQYRLGALGFLSTGDKHATGNYGLKDMVLALKWVKENIKNFGGDPNRITVGGHSASSVAIHYLLMSEVANGLFNQAFMMSGNAFMSYAFQPNPLPRAIKLANDLGIKFKSTEDLVDKLRNVDLKSLLKAERTFQKQDSPHGIVAFDFVPCVEPIDSTYERLITDTPENLMINGKFRKLPILIGITSNEGASSARDINFNLELANEYNTNLNYFIPSSYELSENSTEAKIVAENFKNIYFNGKNLTRDSVNDLSRFYTHGFNFYNDRTIKYFANNSNFPIYCYEFSYESNLNDLKKFILNHQYSGVDHGDDAYYVSSKSFSFLLLPFDQAHTVKARMNKIKTNFIKYGNPIPSTDNLLNTTWPPFKLDDESYMNIGSELKLFKGKPYLNIWRDYQMNLTGHL